MILRAKNNPCYRCKNRTLYCHDNCNRYANYRCELDQVNKAAKQNKEVNNYIHNVVCAIRSGEKRFNFKKSNK